MEDKDEENYSAPMPQNYTGLEYSLDHQQQQQQQLMKPWMGEPSRSNNINGGGGMVDYMLNNPRQPQPISSGFCTSSANSFDKLSFADVMQFADFGPKLALNQNKIQQEEEETGIDPVFFLKFPVLQQPADINEDEIRERVGEEDGGRDIGDDDQEARPPVQIRVVEDDVIIPKNNNNVQESKNKRKRPRTIKTTEEVESQRMTHIAVERNRRKQMNEHLRVLRSLMPGSYVQRGDQASIIGGAIEFVRELEQLLQCLESQKRRRIFGSDQAPRQMGDSSQITIQQTQQPLICAPMAPLPNDQIKLLPDLEAAGLREETAENKSCLADVEVKVLGFDAMIKILSRRRPGQLIKTIAALEDLHLNILHTNITTIEQTVLYSFNVKVGSESRFTAEDMASSVQQIFSFIHANSNNM